MNTVACVEASVTLLQNLLSCCVVRGNECYMTTESVSCFVRGVIDALFSTQGRTISE